MTPRSLAGVEHLVSRVEGRLRHGIGLADLLHATFPGGSITGAPKIAAVDLIAELEPVGRGASMGALGRVHGNGDLELALAIRTFAVAERTLHLWVGGGIVWDSNPLEEVEESLAKAAPLLAAIGAPLEVGLEASYERRSLTRGRT
jgi:para-aminobenzoate synthetase component I